MSDAIALSPLSGPIMSAASSSAAERDARDARWSALMAAAQAGDRGAYDTLLRECLPLLRAICRRRILNPAEAEDAVQDALLTLHLVRHTYDPARPFRPWLSAIAERRAVDRLRRQGRHRRREVEFTAADGIAAPETHAGETRIAAAELHAAVAELPQAQRDALQLTKIQDLSLAEASGRAGTTAGAMKVATHRALHSLRRRFGVGS
ncbi:MAG TPA: sigma-70 family RNA polymerase sigma factor [Acetobacteraceae bacterium]|nr:sigma-70 family RNA polymerase sigma factor [Acetobacteraceae bacterium]